jgi:Ca2+-binding EF-hand superfamily protein
MAGMTLLSRRTVAAAALLVGTTIGPIARAAGPTSTDEARSWAQLHKMKPMEVMHMIDTDKKGYVTREEFMKFQEQLFDRMDKDHDGKVTGQEWMGKGAGTKAAMESNK